MATSKIPNQRENPFIFTGYKNTPFDCNDAPAGLVYCNNAVTNIPIAAGGFLLTLERADSWKTQLYLTVTSSNVHPSVYKRVYDTNIWGDWYLINDIKYVDITFTFDTGLSGAGTFESKTANETIGISDSKIVAMSIMGADTRLAGIVVNGIVNNAPRFSGYMLREIGRAHV